MVRVCLTWTRFQVLRCSRASRIGRSPLAGYIDPRGHAGCGAIGVGMIRPMIGRARASILAAASRRRLGDAAIRPGSSVIGVTVMVGTDPAMRGGIASVVSAYRDGGFFE